MMSRLAILAVFASALALAACNGGNSTPSTPTPGPACTLPPGVQSALVYPAPSATGVNNSSGNIVIDSTTALDPSQWQIVISDAINPGGVGSGTLTSVSPPFPTPNATPSFANPQYQQGSFGAPFLSSQVVKVYLNNFKASNNCAPLQIGQFST